MRFETAPEPRPSGLRAVQNRAGAPTEAPSCLLVGFGTSLGNGCTSGHGICGVSRLSPRSLLATATFMVTGALTVFLARHLGGGEP